MKTFILVVLIIIVTPILANDKWLLTDPKGFDFYLTTEVENNKIEGFTRKNALKNIVGWTKFTLIKIATSIKYPEIMHFKAQIDGKTFKGNYQYLFDTFDFVGQIKGDEMTLTINHGKNGLSQLVGKKVKTFESKRDYSVTFDKIFKLTEDNLYKQSFIQSKNWKKFKKKMLKIAPNIKDDLELQIAFYAIVRNFPFSHYQLFKKQGSPKKSENHEAETITTHAKLNEIDTSTVVLDIDRFLGTKQSMLDLIDEIDNKKYKYLIIDLRNNPGGNFLPAYPLAQYLISEPIIAGVFPNQNWYKSHNRAPNKNEYEQFSEFSGGTMEQWMQLASNKQGVYYKTYPSKKHFDGKVYILTNSRTASTCEPLVYALKQEGIATIVGENTRGAMLAMNTFEVGKGISLGIPVNDYITYAGDRIDKVGISPNVKVDSKKALDEVLKIISQK